MSIILYTLIFLKCKFFSKRMYIEGSRERGKVFLMNFAIYNLILHYKNVNSHYIHCIAKVNNKISHIYNGNIYKRGGIKMVHVNKGNSNFENKIDDIKVVLDNLKPHILSIQEANYDFSLGQTFSGYNIEYNILTNKSNCRSRTIVMIDKGLNYKR